MPQGPSAAPAVPALAPAGPGAPGRSPGLRRACRGPWGSSAPRSVRRLLLWRRRGASLAFRKEKRRAPAGGRRAPRRSPRSHASAAALGRSPRPAAPPGPAGARSPSAGRALPGPGEAPALNSLCSLLPSFPQRPAPAAAPRRKINQTSHGQEFPVPSLASGAQPPMLGVSPLPRRVPGGRAGGRGTHAGRRARLSRGQIFLIDLLRIIPATVGKHIATLHFLTF